MVLVGFVLHMVGGLYVAMLHAQILLKQEDGAYQTWLQEANMHCGWM